MLVNFYFISTLDLINEVKLKLHGLRTSYGHELKMEGTKKIDGQPYTSKWQWYRQLSFLKEAMCFRSRSGSISSSSLHPGTNNTNNNSGGGGSPTNGSRTARLTRRRGRRGLQSQLSGGGGMLSADDMDNNNHNHDSNSYYVTDHEGNDVKIVTIEHPGPGDNGNEGPTTHGGASSSSYSMIDPDYDPPPPPPQHHPSPHQPPHAHHASTSHNAHHLHPGHHSQHTPHPHHLIHMGVHLDDSGLPPEHMQQGPPPQDPHVPVVTYRGARGESLLVPSGSAPPTMTRHDSASNLQLMCLASTSSTPSSTPENKQNLGQQVVGEDLTTSRIIPNHLHGCVCRCQGRGGSGGVPQSAGERLGRLVEETFSNLHPEYHEMARWEIQQVLGKYLQKPIP